MPGFRLVFRLGHIRPGDNWTVACRVRYTINMSRTIPAVFDAGVFRPLEPVELADGTQVQVEMPHTTEQPGAELSPEKLARQQAAVEEMLAEIESLPIEEPDDRFSGRDHDKTLYSGR